jgi:helicase
MSKAERKVLTRLSEEILSIGEQTSLSEVLAKAISCGACAHHAGIHVAHRRLIEKAFRKGIIKILTATPTLAAGVNLPARTVIISSYRRYESGLGRFEIPILEYKQMAGRAGRPKYDEAGEAVLVASTRDEQEFLMEYYVCSRPERVWSKLAVEKALRSHVLATIASSFALTEEGLYDFFSQTFYAYQYGEDVVKRPVASTLAYLIENELVRLEGSKIRATPFGKRASELYIDPVTAVIFRKGLYSNRGSPSNPIALLQLVASTPDLAPKLYPSRREIPELQNFLEENRYDFLLEPPELTLGLRKAEAYLDYEVFLAELKCVKILYAWICEVREAELLDRYGVEPGDLYRLVERAEWLLYAAGELAKLFGKKIFAAPIAELRLRVKHGVKTELLPLVLLEGVGRIRARALYSSGLKTVEDLKKASLTRLLAVPGIGGKLAKQIKEQVGGTVKKEGFKQVEKRGIQATLQEET